MPRRVRHLAVACSAAAVLVPAVAQAKPTPMEPTRISPEFTKGASVTVEWQAPRFTNDTVAPLRARLGGPGYPCVPVVWRVLVWSMVNTKPAMASCPVAVML